MDIANNYNFEESEQKWQKYWEKNKIYKFNPKSKAEIYSIDTPPPTVSGKMHIGHGFMYSQMDFVARFQRMIGKNVFYPFGTDDNGLPTERLIEKTKKVKAHYLGRDKFIKLCLETLEKELRPKYIEDWKRIGISCDWDIFYTTIDKHCQKISQRSFIDLYKEGREYRKEAPTIWCPECRTAIAQVELEDKNLSSQFIDIVFRLEGEKELIIATTRPELLPACVAVFYHPDDKRYRKLKGKKARVPIFNHEVPILPDEKADPEKGTGIVMCCTFGDQTDMEWYFKHNLPLKTAFTEDGKLTDLCGKFKGMKIKEARTAITEELEVQGLLKDKKPIQHPVNVHERCGTEIEILHTKQWFIKYLDLKEEFLKAGKEMNWYPQHMINRYENWIKGLQWDWCISRQRFFGIPFPVWYCKKCDEVILANESQLPVDPLKDKPKIKECPKCGAKEFVPEEDVLDTWATSSLTPQIAASLVPKMYNKLYPMNLRPQAHDIISFWLFNTVVKSNLHEKKKPWKDIMISGWALDPHGKKMSKSKGNVVEPQTVVEKYGADCLRFWAAGSKLGEDLSYQEKDLVTGKKFINKLWNASKFVSMHLQDYKGKGSATEETDKWLLSKLNNLVKLSTDSFNSYEYSKVKQETEKFFWQTFCDNYLEIIKDRIYNPDKYKKGARESAQFTLHTTLLTIIKLMAPIMPYITEELYQLYYKKQEKTVSIHISEWPKFNKSLIDLEAEAAGDLVVYAVTEVRKAKTSQNLSLKAPVKKMTLKGKIGVEYFDKIKADLIGATNAEDILYVQLKKESKIDYESEIEI